MARSVAEPRFSGSAWTSASSSDALRRLAKRYMSSRVRRLASLASSESGCGGGWLSRFTMENGRGDAFQDGCDRAHVGYGRGGRGNLTSRGRGTTHNRFNSSCTA